MSTSIDRGLVVQLSSQYSSSQREVCLVINFELCNAITAQSKIISHGPTVRRELKTDVFHKTVAQHAKTPILPAWGERSYALQAVRDRMHLLHALCMFRRILRALWAIGLSVAPFLDLQVTLMRLNCTLSMAIRDLQSGLRTIGFHYRGSRLERQSAAQ